MSKSLGNYMTQEELLPKYGGEVLRLWVAAEDYSQDIRLSGQILDRLADAYRRIRNTYRFLLGNLADFDPTRDRQPYGRLDEVDRFILVRLARVFVRAACYEEFQFHAASTPTTLRRRPLRALPRHHQGSPLHEGTR
jgi:isoleucyl-tRNA synthetase